MTEGLLGALALVGAVTSVLWIASWTFRAFVIARVPLLSEQAPPAPGAWPTLSVVIPARDEEATTEPALRSLLAQDYPSLEVVMVDDRSTDGTAAILDRLAREDPRLVVEHVDALPDGWLGKVHALQRGVSRARGEWLLFTDADVRFEPGALRRTLAVALHHELDHLTLMPELDATGPLQGGFMALFVDMSVERTRGRRSVEQPGKAPFGFGAFNLMRRARLDDGEGLAWIKLDVLDDLALGALLKRGGARAGFLVADQGVRVLWYASLRAALAALDKNFVGGIAGYRPALLLPFGLVTLAVALGPPLALLQPATAPLFGGALLAVLLAAALARRRYRRRLASGLLEPVAMAALGAYAVTLAFRYARRRELSWRGTSYPFAALRAGRRVGFP